MPTKRQFDMVVITILLMNPVQSFAQMWAARKLSHMDKNQGPVSEIAAGAIRLTQ